LSRLSKSKQRTALRQLTTAAVPLALHWNHGHVDKPVLPRLEDGAAIASAEADWRITRHGWPAHYVGLSCAMHGALAKRLTAKRRRKEIGSLVGSFVG